MKIGIDIGGMSVKIGLVNEENDIIAKKVIPTRLDIKAEEFIPYIIEGTKEILNENHIAIEECTSIGIGSPGTVDPINGIIIYSNNFGWKQVKIIEQMKPHFSCPIRIANDADAAALGEVVKGAAMGAKSAILLTLGTGVGGGVILDKKIFNGPLRGGCELGHMVIHSGGRQCSCGRKGCLEAYASASALMELARENAMEDPTSIMNQMCQGELENMNGIIPFKGKELGDRAAVKTVEEYLDHLACGITNLINIFRPEKILLGGGVAAQKENITIPLQKRVEKECFGGDLGEISQIEVSCLGNDAGIIGAANL